MKSDDEYNYQRVYNHPLKYAALTGYSPTIYGATGPEAAMDKELAGTSDSQFYDRVAQLFSGSSAQVCQRGADHQLEASGHRLATLCRAVRVPSWR